VNRGGRDKNQQQEENPGRGNCLRKDSDRFAMEAITTLKRNKEALGAMNSKLRMLETTGEAWEKQASQLGKQISELEERKSMEEAKLKKEEEQLKNVALQSEKDGEALERLHQRRKSLEEIKSQNILKESQLRSVWKLKESQKAYDKQYQHKKAKLDQMERNLRSTEGGIRMFQSELKAIEALPPAERSQHASPSEIKALRKRVAMLMKKKDAQIKERDAYASKVKAVRVKADGFTKKRDQAIHGIKKLDTTASKDPEEVEKELRRISVAVTGAEKARRGSEERQRGSLERFQQLQKDVAELSKHAELLKKFHDEALDRANVIKEAREVLGDRIARLVQVTSPPTSPRGDGNDVVENPQILGYPITLAVNCEDTTPEKDAKNNFGVPSICKTGGCEGEATVTAFLFMFDSKENKCASPKGEKRGNATRFCVDMDDIETVSRPCPSKESAEEMEISKDIWHWFDVTLRKGHTNRFLSVQDQDDEAKEVLPQRLLKIKSKDGKALEEFYQLLKMASLLHRATTAALPEGYSVIPRVYSLGVEKGKPAVVKPSQGSAEPVRPDTTEPVQKEILPDLAVIGTSKIVSEQTLKRVISMAPSGLHIEDWKMFYSLEHGADLQKMYKAAKGIKDTILLLQDSTRTVFGVFNSSYYAVDDNYYGNGLTFVFQIQRKEEDVKTRGEAPLKELRDVIKHGWSGKNELFVLCKRISLAFGGGGDGGYALRLDKNLCSGSSEKCFTYSSPMLSGNRDFKIYKCEVWGPAPL